MSESERSTLKAVAAQIKNIEIQIDSLVKRARSKNLSNQEKLRVEDLRRNHEFLKQTFWSDQAAVA